MCVREIGRECYGFAGTWWWVCCFSGLHRVCLFVCLVVCLVKVFEERAGYVLFGGMNVKSMILPRDQWACRCFSKFNLFLWGCVVL